jgi:hypothetical protein
MVLQNHAIELDGSSPHGPWQESRQPSAARANPTLMAISAEFGPGMRLVSTRVNHRRAEDFVFNQRDVGSGAAEDCSEFEEQRGQGAQAPAERALGADRGSGLIRLGQTEIVAWTARCGLALAQKLRRWNLAFGACRRKLEANPRAAFFPGCHQFFDGRDDVEN